MSKEPTVTVTYSSTNKKTIEEVIQELIKLRVERDARNNKIAKNDKNKVFS